MILQRSQNNTPGRLKSLLAGTVYRARPGFLIIGAQKGGTNALYSHLAKHPHIVRPRKKEVGYFDQDILYNRGRSWYHSHFQPRTKLGLRGLTYEATPESLYYPKAAERIFSYNPHLKLIALLREPVSRAFSAWNMFRNLCEKHPDYLRQLLPNCDPHLQNAINALLHNKSFPEFDEVVRDEVNRIESNDPLLEPGYVKRGLYHEQLLRYFQYFKPEQLLIIESRRLLSDTATVLDEVFRFLGLSAYSWRRKDLPHAYVGRYDTQMSAKTHTFLRDFYKPFNEKLYESLGADFGW